MTTRARSSTIPLVGCALVGVVPASLAVTFAPGMWTGLALAGASAATSALVISGFRGARELAAVERREAQLQTALASAEARLTAIETQLRESASHDDVTGTLNRRTFLSRLDEAIQRDIRLRKPMALLLIDIEGFRKINGDAGRMIGDRVLRSVGRAIQASTRGTDFVGRIGGDEFAVVLGECADPRPAIDRIFVALHGETTGGDNPLPIVVSIGAVTVDSTRTLDVDPVALFRIAEEALASVRGGGASRCGKRAYPVDVAPGVDATRS